MDLPPHFPVESVKIQPDLSSWSDGDLCCASFEVKNPKANCGLCNTSLEKQKVLTTCFNKQTQKLVCLQDAANLKEGKVHVFHKWCLDDYIQEGSTSCPHPGCRTETEKKMTGSIRLGVDIGGVIIQKAQQANGEDEPLGFFSSNWLSTPLEPDCIDVLNKIVSKGIPVFIVSKCGKNFRQKTLEFLKHVNFFERTGVKIENVHFCEERSGKAEICTNLQITHFIDDSMSVLRHLLKVPTIFQLYFYVPDNQDEEGSHYIRFSPLMSTIQSWNQLFDDIELTQNQ